MAALSDDKTALLGGIRARARPPGRSVHPLLFVISLILLAPIGAIVATAFGDTNDLMPHLLQTVLPRYVANTLWLMAGVGLLAAFMGVITAWIVSRYHFFGVGAFEWLLVLPAAMPAYIIAYSYTDFFEYAGPVQGLLRELFGWQTGRDYWFFDIRSFGGAVIVMASVLYPYIYLLARTAFRQTARALFEVAELGGHNVFFSVALPLARPAIVAGLSLVLMEVVSDFGTVDYFALETLTLGIFNVWLGMNSMAAAAQLALCAFVLIGLLLMMEIFARSRRSFQNSGAGASGVPVVRLYGSRAGAAFIACAVPVFSGFILPVAILVHLIITNTSLAFVPELPVLAEQSFLLAGTGCVLVMIVALISVLLAHYRSGRAGFVMAGAAAAGYAFPGTILAIGVLGFTGMIDQLAVYWLSGPVFVGSFAVLLFGLMVRFQAVGYGALSTGIKRMPPHMMESGLIMGYGFFATMRLVILPLLRPSVIAGGLLVFVDIMKELPITLLLRPFSFETFATYTYQYAKDEMLEIAALPALMIVCAGLLPVFIANRALEQK